MMKRLARIELAPQSGVAGFHAGIHAHRQPAQSGITHAPHLRCADGVVALLVAAGAVDALPVIREGIASDGLIQRQVRINVDVAYAG